MSRTSLYSRYFHFPTVDRPQGAHDTYTAMFTMRSNRRRNFFLHSLGYPLPCMYAYPYLLQLSRLAPEPKHASIGTLRKSGRGGRGGGGGGGERRNTFEPGRGVGFCSTWCPWSVSRVRQNATGHRPNQRPALSFSEVFSVLVGHGCVGRRGKNDATSRKHAYTDVQHDKNYCIRSTFQ